GAGPAADRQLLPERLLRGVPFSRRAADAVAPVHDRAVGTGRAGPNLRAVARPQQYVEFRRRRGGRTGVVRRLPGRHGLCLWLRLPPHAQSCRADGGPRDDERDGTVVWVATERAGYGWVRAACRPH